MVVTNSNETYGELLRVRITPVSVLYLWTTKGSGSENDYVTPYNPFGKVEGHGDEIQ